MGNTERRRGLVIGATGFVGGLVTERLIEEGWQVRVLSRSRSKALKRFGTTVEIIEGDASNSTDLARALEGIETVWYLMHAMSGGDFRKAEKDSARRLARAAYEANVQRIVYLGGLRPAEKRINDLSEHLESRAETGQILLDSQVPTAALQAGIVMGSDSASFKMLRHLSERLPAALGPQWIRHRVTPIWQDDAVHFLVKAADLPADANRSFDIGGPETLEYAQMMQRYARITGLPHHPVVTVPAYSLGFAAWGIACITPLDRHLVTPLVGSLAHDTKVSERDLEDLVGLPEGGLIGFDEAVRRSTAKYDTRLWFKVAGGVTAAVGLTAVAGSLLTDPDQRWYKRLKKPSWQPAPQVFPLAWTALYADIAATGALTLADILEEEDIKAARTYMGALGTNLVLNASWCGLFFRAKKPWYAAAGAAVLAASSADLVRRTYQRSPERGVLLAPYAAWCGFATALSASIARRN